MPNVKAKAAVFILTVLGIAGCGPPPETGSILLRLHPKLNEPYVYSLDLRSWSGADRKTVIDAKGKLAITFHAHDANGWSAHLNVTGLTSTVDDPQSKALTHGADAEIEVDDFGRTLKFEPDGNPIIALIRLAPTFEGLTFPRDPVHYRFSWPSKCNLLDSYPELRTVSGLADTSMALNCFVERMNYKTVTVDSTLLKIRGLAPSGIGRVGVAEDDHLYLDSSDGMPLILTRRTRLSVSGAGSSRTETLCTLTRESP